MAEDLKSLREAAHVIDGLGSRLELAIANLGVRLEQSNSEFKGRLDSAVAGIDKRLSLMTAVFAICVGLGAAAFWNITNKIDASATRVDLALGRVDRALAMFTQIKAGAKASKMSDGLPPAEVDNPTDNTETGSVPLTTTVGGFLNALKTTPPPPEADVTLYFKGPIAMYSVKGKDLVRFLSSREKELVVQVDAPDDAAYDTQLGKMLGKVGH